MKRVGGSQLKASVVFALFWVMCVSAVPAQEPDIIQVREAYRKACLNPSDAETVEQFVFAAAEFSRDDSGAWLEQGFRATAEMMRAEPLLNPFEKLMHFNAGKEPLEEAIAANPTDPDLRLFRLSVQWKVPSFLGYNDRMEEDAACIAEALTSGHWSEDPEHAAFALTFIQHIQDDHSK
jgi:hypothetical protein